MTLRAWSPFQQAIFDAVSDHAPDAPHLAVRARAGSGKTTTGVQALRLTPRGRVLACAFNADIAATLSERVPAWADARTFHSAGLGAITSALGRPKIDAHKVRTMAQAMCPEEARYQRPYVTSLCRVVGLAKSTLTGPDPIALSHLADQFHLDGAPDAWAPERARWASRAAQLLDRCATWDGTIDFDDMCWLPIKLGLQMRAWDFVLADEAQDLNACQHELVKRLVGGRGRLLAIGDDRQAIYQFRGAHANSFDELANHFEAQVLPLSVCYRCDAAIVAAAQRLVPDLTARDGTPDGSVIDASPADMLALASPGDFILSRSKAPLMGYCLELLAEGRPAIIVGRDIAGGLATMVRKSKAATTDQLEAWLRRHTDAAAKRWADSDPEALEEELDRVDCVRAVAQGASSIAGVLERLDRMFADDANGGAIRLSTTHKAKGLETERVWMLADTYQRRPGIEEENLAYVAMTRAMHELVFVRKDAAK